jgi:hypothetical protein
LTKRRTNPYFMSDGEAEQERRRIQQMVKGITKANQLDYKVLAKNDVDIKKHVKPIFKGNGVEKQK